MTYVKGQPPPPGSKPFAKKVSGNPGGRPKGLERALREELRSLRHRIETKDADGTVTEVTEVDGYKAMFNRLWDIIMRGEDKDSLVGLKLLYERTHGLPKQKIPIDDDDACSDDEDEDLSMLSVEELRILAKVRAAREPQGDEPPDNGIH